jgi:MSHA biogenesis protein MshJ
MDYTLGFIKTWYRIKVAVGRLSERDRILLLFIIVVLLSVFWYLVVFSLQMNNLNTTHQKTQEAIQQNEALLQKESLIKSIAMSPGAKQLMAHYQELLDEKSKLENNLTHYTQKTIDAKDLAKLLHDMLAHNDGVMIDDFQTIVQPVVMTAGAPQQTPEQAATDITAGSLAVEAVYYRLVLRGSYFAVMEYLKRLELLSWRLYWDKFDYQVSQYPEGVITITFYTLRPRGGHQ